MNNKKNGTSEEIAKKGTGRISGEVGTGEAQEGKPAPASEVASGILRRVSRRGRSTLSKI